MIPAPDLDVEIIRRSELGNGRAVITSRRGNPHLIRPYAVFVSTQSSRYAAHLRDFSTAAAAEHYHEHLVQTFGKQEKGPIE